MVTSGVSKRCVRCGEHKPPSAYHKRRHEPATCLPCLAAQSRGEPHPPVRWCVRCDRGLPLAAFRGLRTECSECINAARRAGYLDGGHARMIAGHRKRTYGLTPEVYAALVGQQGGCCAICGQELPARGAHVDHDHETGAVRGVLCPRCNAVVLPVVERTPEVVVRAAEYLRRAKSSACAHIADADV